MKLDALDSGRDRGGHGPAFHGTTGTAPATAKELGGELDDSTTAAAKPGRNNVRVSPSPAWMASGVRLHAREAALVAASVPLG